MFDRFEEVAFIGESIGPVFFYDPSEPEMESFLHSFRDLDVQAATSQWPFAQPDRALDALAAMKKCLQDENSEKLLKWDYRKLFVGPYPMSAPPWGSVYTDPECVVFGESTLRLRMWMTAKGVAFLSEEKTPEDHIGAMLLLMAWIARNRPELLAEYLQDHLLTWANHFLDLVESASESEFYRGAAQLTASSLTGIQQELSLKVDYPVFYR